MFFQMAKRMAFTEEDLKVYFLQIISQAYV